MTPRWIWATQARKVWNPVAAQTAHGKTVPPLRFIWGNKQVVAPTSPNRTGTGALSGSGTLGGSGTATQSGDSTGPLNTPANVLGATPLGTLGKGDDGRPIWTGNGFAIVANSTHSYQILGVRWLVPNALGWAEHQPTFTVFDNGTVPYAIGGGLNLNPVSGAGLMASKVYTNGSGDNFINDGQFHDIMFDTPVTMTPGHYYYVGVQTSENYEFVAAANQSTQGDLHSTTLPELMLVNAGAGRGAFMYMDLAAAAGANPSAIWWGLDIIVQKTA